MKITGKDSSGKPKSVYKEVEVADDGTYTYQLTVDDGIADGSDVTVKAETTDINGTPISADDDLKGYSAEDNETGLDLVDPTIMIGKIAGSDLPAEGGKIVWGNGDLGTASSSKQGFDVTGTTMGVEEGQVVTVTFNNVQKGKEPVVAEGVVNADGSWTVSVTSEQAGMLLDGAAVASVKDKGNNDATSNEARYTVGTPSASVTEYIDNIDNVQTNVKLENQPADSVEISSNISLNPMFTKGDAFVDEFENELAEPIKHETDHGVFTLDLNGEWTYKLNADAQLPEKGPLTEVFTVEDNAGKKYEVKVSIKNGEKGVTVSATTSSLKDDQLIESDEGSHTIHTNDSLGEIKGTASFGVETVRVYINKAKAGDDNANETTFVPEYFDVKVVDGKWSLSEALLEAGLQEIWLTDQLNNDDIYIEVRAVDPTTGKVGEISDKYTFVVDTIVPEATYVQYNEKTGEVSAYIADKKTDSKGAEIGDKVTVTYTDTNGNVQTVTGEVEDKLNPHDKYFSINVSGVDTSNVDVSAGFKVYVTDKAGNTGVNNNSQEDPTRLKLPTPVVDQYLDNVNPENDPTKIEIIGNGGISNDPKGQISGTIVLSAEDYKIVDSIRVYAYDDLSKFIEIPKKDLVKDAETGEYRWTTTEDQLKNLLTTGEFAENRGVDIKAAAYDEETGQLGDFSNKFKVTIDVTAPEIEIDAITVDGVISQIEKKDGYTITGSTKDAVVGDSIEVTLNNKTYETKVGQDGKWEVKVPADDASKLEDGQKYPVTATVTDTAGNKAETNKETVVNASPKAESVTISGNEEDVNLVAKVIATDAEKDSLTYELVNGSIPEHIGSLTIDPITGDVKFTPAKDWSGEESFKVEVTDQYGNSTTTEIIVDIKPVIDKPMATDTDMGFDVGELQLNRHEWKGIRGKQYIGGKIYDFDDTRYQAGERPQGVGNGINKDVLVNGLEALLKHREDKAFIDQTTSLQSDGWISKNEPGNGLDTYSAVYIKGFVYLEEGKDYKFVGSTDDAGMIIIGDEAEQYTSWRGVGSAGLDETFKVANTGFYTFDLYIYNQSNIGNYNFKVTEADGSEVKYYPSTQAIEKELPDYVQLTDKLNDGKDADGKGYYGIKYGYKGSETDSIILSKLKASLTDRDGSETLKAEFSGLVEGAELTYYIIDKDGVKSELKTATAGKDGKIQIDGKEGDVDFVDFELKLPEGVDQAKDLKVTLAVTATETGTGESLTSSHSFDVQVLDPDRVVTATKGDDIISTGSTGNDTVIYDLLVKADAKGGHGVDTWIDFEVGNTNKKSDNFDSNADIIEFAKGFFEGLSEHDIKQGRIDKLGKFIKVDYDADSETATISIDRDGDKNRYSSETLLVLPDQSNEITLEELLNNNQIVIGY